MAPRAPVLDDLGSSCICCDVAANIACLSTHGIPCVEKTLFCNSLAEIICNDTRLADCHHIDLVYFKDLVHLLQRKNDASIKWNGSTCKSRTCASWGNGDVLCIRKFHQLGDLLFVLGLNNNFWHMRKLFPSFIIGIRLYLLGFGHDILLTKDRSQLPQGFGGHLVVLHVNSVSYTHLTLPTI